MSLETCPVCAEGKLHPQNEMREVEYNGHTGKLAMHYSLCDDCGSEVAEAAEIEFNKNAMMTFRQKIDESLATSRKSSYPKIGQRIRWTNVPANVISRGDTTGVVTSRDGEYIYCRMDGTKSIVELYPSEIEEIE